MEGEELEDAVPFNRLLFLLNTKNKNLLLHLQKNIEAGYLKTEDEILGERSSVACFIF